MSSSEKRKYIRYRPDIDSETLDIAIELPGNQIAVHPSSISQNGCDFLLEFPLPLWTKLSMNVDLSGCKIEGKDLSPVDKFLSFEGTVVRIEEKPADGRTYYHTAVFFGELPRRITSLLVKLFDHKGLKPVKSSPRKQNNE